MIPKCNFFNRHVWWNIGIDNNNRTYKVLCVLNREWIYSIQGNPHLNIKRFIYKHLPFVFNVFEHLAIYMCLHYVVVTYISGMSIH